MSERQNPGGEKFKAPEQHEAQEHHESAHHKNNPEHESSRQEKQEQAPVAELEKRASHEAQSHQHLAVEEKAPADPSTLLVNRELKGLTFKRTMTRVRKHLSAPNRALSKVVHQPVVNTISTAGGKTVARPSGVLMGGLCAFIGSSIVLWMAKYYGFAYNYLLFLIIFVVGFCIGLLIEALMKALHHPRV